MTTSKIPPEIDELVDREGGVLLRSVAEPAGVSMHRIYRLVHDGALTSLFPGCYVPTSTLQKLDEWKRFALRGRAFAQSQRAFLTGWAATVVRDLPTLGKPPSRPTVVRPRRRGSGGAFSRDYGRLLVANLPREHRRRIGPLLIASAAWNVADVARTVRLPHSLVVADAAKRQDVDLEGAARQLARFPGAGRARWVAKYVDGTAETPLETLGRFTFLEFDLPLPVLNAWVGFDGPERRIDGLLPWHWWVYEGDGAGKYTGGDSARVHRAQNDREFWLRRLGLDFVRYDWSDVFPRRDGFAHRLRAMFRDHPASDEPIRWWKNVPGVGPVEPGPEDWPSRYASGVILPAGWSRDLA